MKTNVTRRDLLRFAGGSAIGVMLSPAPWKLVDDLAIWTQNWKWIPVPLRGEQSFRQANCSLCPAGCSLTARCIGGRPVSFAAADGSGVCPLGLSGHHLGLHPARLRTPLRLQRSGGGFRTAKLSNAAATAEVAAAVKSAKGTVAILDMRRGRSLSCAWRALAAGLPRGVVIPAPGREEASFNALTAMSGDARRFAADLESAEMIVSFGAPLLEGWGSGQLLRRLANGAEIRLVQVQPTQSATAEAADRWIPAKPGSEAAIALAIGHVLVSEKLVTSDAIARIADFDRYSALVEPFSPSLVAALAGVDAESIVATAREMAASRRCAVLAGEEPGQGPLGATAQTAILGLNLLLADPAVVPATEAIHPFDSPLAPLTEIDDVPDGSVEVLIIDASDGELPLPWSLVERTLQPNARVIAISPYLAGAAARADIAIPAPAFLESIQELTTPADAVSPRFAVTAALRKPIEGATDPVALIRSISQSASIPLPEGFSTSEELIRARSARIHAAGKGFILGTDGTRRDLRELASADDFWTAIADGGRWEGEAAQITKAKYTMLSGRGEELATSATARPEKPGFVALLPRGVRDVGSTAVVSPVMTKLYQESGLRHKAGTVVVNERTAQQLALRRGMTVRVATNRGALEVTLETSPTVMPGLAEISLGPDERMLGRDQRPGKSPLDLFEADASGVWRTTAARLLEA
jgi:anaerobic selenocysteine-containing dehydrogenase